MEEQEKLLIQILKGKSDVNINFQDLVRLKQRFGFDKRVSGGHHIFRKEGVLEKINLQKEGSKAKLYHVLQVRNVISKI
jgi:hypothetical protein